jgi:hypothetical protein
VEKIPMKRYDMDCGNQAHLVPDGDWVKHEDAIQRISELERKLAVLLYASKGTFPCFEDWIRTTGFGEVNCRDREAFAALKLAIRETENESEKKN